MDSRRQMKLVSVIREAFTDILARDGKNIYGKSFVTVTNVKITSDLSLVRFYISIFNAENPEEVIHQFNEQKTDLKRKLAEKVRHQLRIMPNIEFFRDETLEYASHMDEVFKKIKEEDKRIVELGMQNDEPKEKSSPVKKAAKPTVKKIQLYQIEIAFHARAAHCFSLPLFKKINQRYQYHFLHQYAGYGGGGICFDCGPVGFQRI